MFHPLVSDLRKVKDQELENKILELSKKYSAAANMGMGGACSQIITLLDMYKMELDRRQRENMQAIMKKQNKDLDDLINVD